MSTAFMEEFDYEDAYDDAEIFDDAEAYDDAEASRARRRRAQQLKAARLRAANRRGVSTLPATAPPRAVVSAVKELDLQAQVQQDTLRGVMAAQNKRLDRANLATVATLLVGEAFRTFGTPGNDYLRAGLQAAPLLLLTPSRNRGGVEGLIRHPAAYGGVAALGLAFVRDQRNRTAAVQRIDVLGPSRLTVGAQDAFTADILDAGGKPSTLAPTWESDNTQVATIDRTTGRITAGTAPGVAVLTVRAGEFFRRFRLEVVAAPAGTK